MISLFKFPSEASKERMRKHLPQKAVAINQLANHKIDIEACVKAFHKGFEDALDIELVPYELTQEQQDFVENLAKTKYETDEWNFRK